MNKETEVFILSIEENTITHAVVLSLNGKIAKRWFDLPDTVLNIVAEQKGEIIAGGEDEEIVRVLATNGLGSLYAEEIMLNTEIRKNKTFNERTWLV